MAPTRTPPPGRVSIRVSGSALMSTTASGFMTSRRWRSTSVVPPARKIARGLPATAAIASSGRVARE